MRQSKILSTFLRATAAAVRGVGMALNVCAAIGGGAALADQWIYGTTDIQTTVAAGQGAVLLFAAGMMLISLPEALAGRSIAEKPRQPAARPTDRPQPL